MNIINTSALDNQEDLLKDKTKVENKPEIKEKESNEKNTIVLDGSLSSIYTKALNIYFSKQLNNNPEENVSKESQQLDSSMRIIPITDFGKDLVEDDVKYKDQTYAYVTDCDSINDNDKNEVRIAFENISKVVNKNMFKNVIVCIEGFNLSNKTAILEEYFTANNIKVYHTRKGMLGALSHAR